MAKKEFQPPADGYPHHVKVVHERPQEERNPEIEHLRQQVAILKHELEDMVIAHDMVLAQRNEALQQLENLRRADQRFLSVPLSINDPVAGTTRPATGVISLGDAIGIKIVEIGAPIANHYVRDIAEKLK